MKTLIKCHTLFDITNTGILTRRTPINLSPEQTITYENNRKKQHNFDTLLQIIGLRTQPEDISSPQQYTTEFKNNNIFGFLFEDEESQPAWNFTFSISYHGVYNDGINELGGLYNDCDGVPMLKIGEEWDKLPNFLDTTPELRNIYFEVISNE